MTYREPSLASWLPERSALTPDRVAIDFQDRAISYRELLAASLARADELAALNLPPGGRVATLARNSPEQVEVFFACAMRGWMMVPLNWRLATPELAHQVGDSGAGVLLASPDLMPEARQAVIQAATPTEVLELGPPRVAAPTPQPAAEVGPDTPLLLIYTSGTTGRPKGAVLTHGNCFWTNLSLDRTASLEDQAVVLQVLPQYHVGGWNVQPLLAWWKGATVVLADGFEPTAVLRLIEAKRVTTMMGVPTMYQMLAQHPDFSTADLSSLRQVIVGGAPIPRGVLDSWLGRGVTLLQGYGLTEAAPNVLCVPPECAKTKAGSAGRPYLHVQVRLDPQAAVGAGSGRPGPDDVGELLVFGPNVFAGYWHDPAATQEVLAQGWLRTGDIAQRDADGFYWIKGRRKEMYISGGENVYPAEVEEVLLAHPGVREAAVVGVPDDRWGETGAAFIVTGEPGVNEEDLRRWVSARLARFKAPHHWVFVAALPRAAEGGKVLRRALLDDWASRRANQHGS